MAKNRKRSHIEMHLGNCLYSVECISSIQCQGESHLLNVKNITITRHSSFLSEGAAAATWQGGAAGVA